MAAGWLLVGFVLRWLAGERRQHHLFTCLLHEPVTDAEIERKCHAGMVVRITPV